MSGEPAPGEPWYYVLRVSPTGRGDPECGPDGPYTFSEAQARATGPDRYSGWRSIVVVAVSTAS